MNKNITTALIEHSKSLDKIDIDRINTATELIKKSLVSGNKVFGVEMEEVSAGKSFISRINWRYVQR